MSEIRPYASGDLEALYQISLATGDAGSDAAHLYRDHNLIGHIYAGPYATLSPNTALVVEDDLGVAGYIVGALDTRAFEARLETEWWPKLRTLYRDPTGSPIEQWSADARRSWTIHHPPRAPAALVGSYPSHLHINLLPRAQGRGLGRSLIDRWLAIARTMGSMGVHLGVNSANERAIGFYRALGLCEPELAATRPGTIWFAAPLN